MRICRATLACITTALMSVVAAREAHAGDMDPTTERLVNQPPNLPPGATCQSIAADPGSVARPQDFPCRPNNLAFANMMSELGFAIAPSAFYPARTTGIGGFQLSIEASYTNIFNEHTVSTPSGNMRYWYSGTRGGQDQNTKQFSVVNTAPDSILQIYALKARKGLPLGFEVAGSLGYISNTTLWVGGGDIRWSMLEGFRTGALGILPDISVGTGVRTVTGTSRFYLTTVGIDVRASKPIALADSSQLIPSVGYQRVIIFGDSNVVDSTPSVDASAQCGIKEIDQTTGAPVCNNRLPSGAPANTDFANNFTFDRVRIHRNRGFLALNYRYELIWIGSQLAFDINKPSDENPGIGGNRQWTLSFEGGVHF